VGDAGLSSKVGPGATADGRVGATVAVAAFATGVGSTVGAGATVTTCTTNVLVGLIAIGCGVGVAVGDGFASTGSTVGVRGFGVSVGRTRITGVLVGTGVDVGWAVGVRVGVAGAVHVGRGDCRVRGAGSGSVQEVVDAAEIMTPSSILIITCTCLLAIGCHPLRTLL